MPDNLRLGLATLLGLGILLSIALMFAGNGPNPSILNESGLGHEGERSPGSNPLALKGDEMVAGGAGDSGNRRVTPTNQDAVTLQIRVDTPMGSPLDEPLELLAVGRGDSVLARAAVDGRDEAELRSKTSAGSNR